MATQTINILAFGDVVARAGRRVLSRELSRYRSEHDADFVIVNGENAATGNGITQAVAKELFDAGADVVTLGDHTWRHREARDYLDRDSARCIRPANYPEGAPGKGCTLVEISGGVKIGVMNLIGRVFFNTAMDCPFREADQILAEELKDAQIVVCDFHAEATSEKIAIARYLEGRASLVFGTHTHVQTSDERILSGHTAAITDVGMCGPHEGVIGMDAKVALSRLTTGLPSAYKPAEGAVILNGVAATIDCDTGKALSIERICEVFDE